MNKKDKLNLKIEIMKDFLKNGATIDALKNAQKDKVDLLKQEDNKGGKNK